MKDVWEPNLHNRIESFMGRKAREFPELELSKKWYDYEVTPKRKNFGGAIK